MAVLVLLLIPSIFSMYKKFKYNIFKASVNELVKDIRHNYSIMEAEELVVGEVLIVYSNGVEIIERGSIELSTSGRKPDSGGILITKDGDLALALYQDGYCALKNMGNEKVTIEKMNENDCEVEGLPRETYPELVFDINTNTITGYSGTSTEVEIPKSVRRAGVSYDVITIGANAFSEKNITKLTLSEGVKKIGASAFFGIKITELVIPDSVEEIEKDAVRISTLKKLYIGKGLSSPINEYGVMNEITQAELDADAVYYSGCGGSTTVRLVFYNVMDEVSVSENNPVYKSIDNMIYTKDGKWLVLGNKNGGTNIKEGTIGIASYAFLFTQIEEVLIPDSVQYIRDHAFIFTKITEVNILNSVKMIGTQAFKVNTLTEVTIGNGITDIYKRAFDITANITVAKGQNDFRYFKNSCWPSFGDNTVTFNP